MTWQILVAVIGSVGTIIGGLVYVLKRLDWQFSKTPIQEKQGIDQDVQKEKDGFEKTGRPQ